LTSEQSGSARGCATGAPVHAGPSVEAARVDPKLVRGFTAPDADVLVSELAGDEPLDFGMSALNPPDLAVRRRRVPRAIGGLVVDRPWGLAGLNRWVPWG
jgi:hypothetical protein